MSKVSLKAVMLFREADPLAQNYVNFEGNESTPYKVRVRLAELMEALHNEVGIPGTQQASPLFVDMHTDYLKMHEAQCIRKKLLEKSQNVVHE